MMHAWVYLELSNGGFTLVDQADLPLVQDETWRHKRDGRHIYVFNGHGLRMHRVLLDAPDGMLVDHVNGNGLDNRRSNLRLCTQQENQRNRQHGLGVHSRFRGVTLHTKSGRWQAQIKVDGKSLYLGLFDDEREAARAYDAAAREHFGEFANPNFDVGQEVSA